MKKIFVKLAVVVGIIGLFAINVNIPTTEQPRTFAQIQAEIGGSSDFWVNSSCCLL